MSYEKMYKTTATLWIGDAEDQPVVKVDKEEIIEGYEVKINQLKLGYHITAFINLEVAPVQPQDL